MASRSEIARQDQATEQRRADACAALTHAGQDATPEIARDIAASVLGALIEAIEGEADDITELRRKGWQTKAREHQAAALVVKEWRDDLMAWTPPKPIEAPAHVEIPSAHGLGVEPGPATVADLEARLADSFGPELAPIRHVMTVLKPIDPVSAGGPVLAPERGPLCGAKTGSWTHRSGANCVDCIAQYDEEHGPYTGPIAYGNTPPERRDGPVTPAVAAAIREEVEAEALLAAGGMTDMNDARQVVEQESTWSAEALKSTFVDPFEQIRRETVAMMDKTLTERVERELAAGIDAGGAALREFVFGSAKNAAMPNFVDPSPRPTSIPLRSRMTAAQVREHGLSRQRGAHHRSVSQVQGYSECGTRAALSDLERPAWWSVGGKALHRAVEAVNRGAHSSGGGVGPTDPEAAEKLFLIAFDREIVDQLAATPQFPLDTWRAGKKGSEHYDFWRVEGPVMVARWVTWLSRQLADGWEIATSGPTLNAPPVIELECLLDVGIGVPNLSIIDLALFHPHRNVLNIIDMKAGASAPSNTFQLGVYGWSLLAAGVAGFVAAPDLSNVLGAYWRARTGETAVADLPVLTLNPWPDVVQRYRDVHAMESQGIYVPNVTPFCGGCGVADLCPAKATAPPTPTA